MSLTEYVFMHDNDPKHKSKLVHKYLEGNVIVTLIWPAQSPDINPFENLWSIIKVEISKKKPKNLDELKEVILETWNSISLETCQNLAISLRNRQFNCIAIKEMI